MRTFLRTIMVICAFITASSLSAQHSYEQYLQAHNAYAQGNYGEAAALFAQLPVHSFPVLYNLGWARYKQGDSYNALVAFFRATRVASGSEQIQAHGMYEQMQKELGVYKARSFYYASCLRLAAYVPDLLLQILSLLLLCLLALCMVYRRKGLLVYSLLVCAIGVMAATYMRYQEKNNAMAFAKQDPTVLHAGPGMEYGIVANVLQGTVGTIVSRHELWYCVAFDHQRGWVPANDVDLVV